MVTQDTAATGSLLVQLIPSLVLSLILAVPFVRILRKAGRSGWWALFLLIPFLGFLILPWVIAFMRWEQPEEPLGQVFH